MGKTRELKKIRDTKGTFYTRMGVIKNRNGKDQTQAEEIKKKWQKHREEILYQKGLNDSGNHDVVTRQEPDVLKCKVKWALGSIITNKASGGDGIPA